MKASLPNYRQSPRKVRLVAGAVKGKKVAAADTILAHMPKRAAEPIQKLIKSAAANAKNAGAKEENLTVANIEVNKGIVLKRWMPRAMGRASRINKRTSHVTVTLKEEQK
jgi:large subunit ribosomal protein L22